RAGWARAGAAAKARIATASALTGGAYQRRAQVQREEATDGHRCAQMASGHPPHLGSSGPIRGWLLAGSDGRKRADVADDRGPGRDRPVVVAVLEGAEEGLVEVGGALGVVDDDELAVANQRGDADE